MANKNLFNSIKIEKNKKNVFDLSHDVKFSCDMGKLIPTMCLDCIPGDKVDLGAEMLTRFSPMLAPTMHRFDASAHYFFVPKRILWPGWEAFMRNGEADGTGVPAHPYITVSALMPGGYTELMDYLGIPPMDTVPGGNPDQTQAVNVSAMPFAAYQKIIQEYFLDPNLSAPTGFTVLANGDNTAAATTLTTLMNRCWEHDYFTSALPFAQRGPTVNLPIIAEYDDVPVRVNNDVAPGVAGNISVGGTPVPIAGDNPDNPMPGEGFFAETSQLNTTFSTTINELRRATKLQEWFERMAVAGHRYAEQLWSFFNVRNQDARLQRPEYIKGVKTPISISEVLNTTGTVDAPQGEMAGHGIGVMSGGHGSYNVMEHGYIMCIVSIMPKTAYQQGIPKHFLKINDFTEHFWPQFANIGEQPIQQQEVYAYTANAGDTFGYTPRYAEYKYENNRVCGQFRTTLNFWHAGRIFPSEPALNETFVNADPTKRIFAVTDPAVHSLICHILHKVRAVRQMPKFGTPSI